MANHRPEPGDDDYRPRGALPQYGVTLDQRRGAAIALKEYKRYWGMTNDELAVELVTYPSMISKVLNAGPFASSRLVVAALELPLDMVPQNDISRARLVTQGRLAADAPPPRERVPPLRPEPEQPRTFAPRPERAAVDVLRDATRLDPIKPGDVDTGAAEFVPPFPIEDDGAGSAAPDAGDVEVPE